MIFFQKGYATDPPKAKKAKSLCDQPHCPLPVAGALATVPTVPTVLDRVTAPHGRVDADRDPECRYHCLSNMMAMNCNRTATIRLCKTMSMLHAQLQAKPNVVAINAYQRRFLIQ